MRTDIIYEHLWNCIYCWGGPKNVHLTIAELEKVGIDMVSVYEKVNSFLYEVAAKHNNYKHKKGLWKKLCVYFTTTNQETDRKLR